MKKLSLVVASTMLCGNLLAYDSYYNSDGSYGRKMGNTTYHSDGSYSRQMGDTIHHSDGSFTRLR